MTEPRWAHPSGWPRLAAEGYQTGEFGSWWSGLPGTMRARPKARVVSGERSPIPLRRRVGELARLRYQSHRGRDRGAAVGRPTPAKELPLGARTLEERRTRTAVAPGVSLTRIARGRVSSGRDCGPLARGRAQRGRLASRLGVELSDGLIPGREPVSAMAGRVGALAAVNGGFFGSEGVFDGDPIGVLGLGGQLLSEPVGGRAALVLPPPGAGVPLVTGLRFTGGVQVSGRGPAARRRQPGRGLIPGCGGRGGDRPSQRPGAEHRLHGLQRAGAAHAELRTRAPGPTEAGWRRS